MPFEPSDEELMTLYQHGDGSAGALLFERYRRPLYGYVRRLSGRESDAADLMQEVFLRVHEARETFAGRGSFRSWLYRIATNLSYNANRDRRPRESRLVHVDFDKDEVAGHRDSACPCSEWTPRDAMTESETAQLLEDAIAALPFEYRTVFLLRQREGLDYEAIARILDEEPGATRVRFHRARKRLLDDLLPVVELEE